MLRLGVYVHLAPVRSRDACTPEKSCILVHVQRNIPDGIWVQQTLAEIMDKTK
jgi:hypothetical protein